MFTPLEFNSKRDLQNSRRYSTTQLILLQLSFLAISLGFFYEPPIGGGTLSFSYISFIAGSVVFIVAVIPKVIVKLMKPRFYVSTLIQYPTLIALILSYFLLHINLNFVEIHEIAKGYISSFMLILLPVLVDSVTHSRHVYSIIELYLNILFVNALFGLVQFGFLSLFGLHLRLPWQVFDPRPAGFFMEPSYFGVYSLMMSLLPKDLLISSLKKVRIVILALALSFSLISIISAFLALVSILRIEKNKLEIFKLGFIVFVLLIFGFFIGEGDGARGAFSRIERFVNVIQSRDPTMDGSFFYRVYSGFLILTNEDLSRIIQGYGPGDTSVIALNYKGDRFYMQVTSWHFMNGLTSSILGFGLGLFAIMIYFIFYQVGLYAGLILLLILLVDAKGLYNPLFIAIYLIGKYLRQLSQLHLKDPENLPER